MTTNGWHSVADELPQYGKQVLAYYRNTLNNPRMVMAKWIPAKTEEATEEFEEPEYCEETDTYYLPEGWYECIDNWPDYTSVVIYPAQVTHWRPMPMGPEEAV
jgi:hypothetical protein